MIHSFETIRNRIKALERTADKTGREIDSLKMSTITMEYLKNLFYYNTQWYDCAYQTFESFEGYKVYRDNELLFFAVSCIYK